MPNPVLAASDPLTDAPTVSRSSSVTAARLRIEVSRRAAEAAAGADLPIENSVIEAMAVEVEQLREALTSRSEIEQAKGIIMAIDRCTEGQAFLALVAVSQHHNLKVQDLARALANYTGDQATDEAAGPIGSHGLGVDAVVRARWGRHLSSSKGVAAGA